MSQERALRARLRTLATLHEAVGALRSLSAHHFRAVRSALPAARAYRREVEATLGVLPGALQAGISPDAPPGLIVVGADLGLCGDYSARIAAEAIAASAEAAPGHVYCIGRRVERALVRSGLTIDLLTPAPASVAGLTRVLLPLVDAIVGHRQAGEVGRIVLVSARFEGAGRFSPSRTVIPPVETPAGPPTLGASPYARARHLAAVLLREFLYVSLYESFLDALAAEHGKRLVAAQGAWSWLGERIDAASRVLGAVRREMTTQEVLEVATGARLLRAGAEA